LSYKTDAYQILRHPEGGRKDVLRWADLEGKPAAELEIYRPSGELGEPVPATADIAGRLDSTAARASEVAGVSGSIFGAVTLLRFNGEADGARSCINFLERTDQRPSCWFSCNF
jgi:hypothetical protein